VQSIRQAAVLAHAKPPGQGTTICGAQAPAPVQCEASVRLDDWQLVVPHWIPVPPS
jgi:hypothetical protein